VFAIVDGWNEAWLHSNNPRITLDAVLECITRDKSLFVAGRLPQKLQVKHQCTWLVL